jgi:hypothetical protein
LSGGWGGVGKSDGAGTAVSSSTIAQNLDDVQEGDDDDGGWGQIPSSVVHSGADAVSGRPKKKNFWALADPINNIVPETMDFTKMVEAGEFAANGGATNVPSHIDPATAALHAELREAWGISRVLPLIRRIVYL